MSDSSSPKPTPLPDRDPPFADPNPAESASVEAASPDQTAAVPAAFDMAGEAAKEPKAVETPTDAAAATSPFWAALESKADWLSDFVNPILVKEIRQSLKGRAFSVTFGAVLLLAWSWSIFGVALRAPSIYYVPGGRYMLLGYFVISLLPLILVVPFSTFRSLAAEREDGTYELLSITDMRPWQVVLGKLSGAVLQIAIYLSALSPCLVITYFLRGIDIFMIMLFIGALALISILLSALALIIAAQARQRRFQAASSIALLMVLVLVGFASTSFGFTVIFTGVVADIRNPFTWIVIAMVLSMWSCLLALLVLGAAASITFASDNRATPLRVAMLATHAVWFGWVTYIWQSADFEEEVLYAYVAPALIFWWVAASHCTGEGTNLTPRVRRGLPQSAFGRMLATLFFPGRGLGYFFTLANLVTMVVLTGVLESQSQERDGITVIALIGLCYVVAYVGVANLILRVSARAGFQGAVRGYFANIALVAFGVFIPLSIQWSNPRVFTRDYHPIQASNPFWTIAEISDATFEDFLVMSPQMYLAPLIVFVTAVLMLLVNFVFAAREMMAARAVVPVRVEQEQMSLRGQEPEPEQPHSPWDDS